MSTQNKNIIITGASGFIGSCMVDYALQKGFNVFAVIRKNSNKQYLKNPAINFIEFDFNDTKSIDVALQQFVQQHQKIDYIIHGAGVTKSLHAKEFDEGNYVTTKNLAEALERNNCVPTKFLLVSSLAAFGCGLADAAIDENQTPQPITEYGKSKLKAENYLKSKTNFPFAIVNPTAVYGPRDKDFFFLLKSIKQGVEMYINNTKQKLSFVFVEDLVEAIFIVLESNQFNKNFIVSDGQNQTSKEFNNLVKQALGVKTFTIILPAFIVYVVASISEFFGRIQKKTPLLNRERLKEFKAKNWSVNFARVQSLGFTPKYNLEKGLQKAVNWYKENGWFDKK